jgi:hypothetical protein
VNAGQLPNILTDALALGKGTSITGTGDNNTFVGNNAGALNTLGFGNTFVGNSTGDAITVGFNNTLIGAFAGSNLTASTNTMVGTGAGGVTTSGGSNSFFGNQVASGNTTGANNVFMGEIAGGANVSGSGNTALGTQADFGSGTLTNATAIGFQAEVTASNSMVLGSIAGVNGATANTNVGIGVTAPLTRLDVDGGLTIRKPANIALAGGANAITIGDRSYLRLQSASTIAGTTVNLGNGLATGQLLIIECAAGVAQGFTVADNNNTVLQADRAMNVGDTLTLIWNGNDWVEITFAQN